jgi:hypothetical protein
MDVLGGQEHVFGRYMSRFVDVCGDRRTQFTLDQTIQGIIGGLSLCCAQIARSAPGLAATDSSEQRIRDMVDGRSTKNSPDLDEHHIVQRLVVRGVEMLSGDDEIWVAMDTSDLRKPYATKMPDLMGVLDLNKNVVPGYRLITALGLGHSARGVLYHHLFSSTAADFRSEPQEAFDAVDAVSSAIEPLSAVVTFLVDRGFDNIAFWQRVWQKGHHLVGRIRDLGRIVFRPTPNDRWERTVIQNLTPHLRPLATLQAEMEVRMVGQKREYRQKVTAQVSAVKAQLRNAVTIEKKRQRLRKDVWIVHVQLEGTVHEPWWLITDWPVETAEDAQRAFRMYCSRWAAEDGYKFIKGCFGWEEVQVMEMRGIRLLVTLAWVAAAFLYELGVTWDWAEVQLLARLGGYVPHKGRKPGKIALCRGLHRLYDSMSTINMLNDYVSEHGDLPPRIRALIQGRLPLQL